MERISFESLYDAYLDCRIHKSTTYNAEEFEMNAMFNVQRLLDEINSGAYRLSPSQCFLVFVPKVREVFCASFRDRVVHHWMMRELTPCIERHLIYDNANCRIGKGTDFALRRVRTFISRITDNHENDDFYCLKIDLSAFFMSIDRQKLLDMTQKLIETDYRGKYPETLRHLLKIYLETDVTEKCIFKTAHKRWKLLPPEKSLFGNSHGLAIGNLPSQILSNLYLAPLDHLIKHDLKCRYYMRYVDDAIILGRTKSELEEVLDRIRRFLPELNMRLNMKKTRIFHAGYGIPFLGKILYPYHSVLSKDMIHRMWSQSYSFRNAQETYESMAGRRGIFVRYKCRCVMERWYDRLPYFIRRHYKMGSDMKSYLLSEI
ncbi:MAG: RNA-directed DNA polymerase [Spirochaetia bacterium]|nr:RNA-directed DNA polymerase [Spirochaetia bacterium]